MKKVGAILLAAAMGVTMAATFSACGEENGGDTGTTKTVKVWLHKSQTEDEGKTYKAIEELFNEADYKTKDGKDIVMKIEFKSNSDQLQTAINSEMSMGGGAGLPDVFALDAPYVAYYANSRSSVIVPIDDYVTAEEKADYVDSVIEQSTYEGKLYALSGADAPGGLYYNKELLAKVGLTPGTAENPWSWKDLANAVKKLKAAGEPYRVQLSLGFGGNEGLMYLHSPLIYSAGGEFAGADGKVKASLTSDKSLAGLNMLTDFVQQSKSDTDSWIYTGTNENAFPAGEIAFQVFGPWLTRTISKNYKDFEDKYDVMPYPVYEDANGKGTVATPCGSWGFAVTKAARDVDAAAQVVKFLTGAEASELLYDSIGTFPTHKSVLDAAEDFNSGALKSFATLLTDTAKARPKLTNYNKLRDAYARIIEVADTETSNWGIVHFDDVVTYYPAGTTMEALAENEDTVTYNCSWTENVDGEDVTKQHETATGTFEIAWVEAENTVTPQLLQISKKVAPYVEVTATEAETLNVANYLEDVEGAVIGEAHPTIQKAITKITCDGTDTTSEFDSYTFGVGKTYVITYKLTYTDEDNEKHTAEATFTLVVIPDGQIKNGGFEYGDMTGWTTEKEGFKTDTAVIGDATYWGEELPYNQSGNYHLDGFDIHSGIGEGDTWSVKSETFVLGGAGIITVKMGGHAAAVKVYEVNGDNETLIGYYKQDHFNDAHFPDVAKGSWADMRTYVIDLGQTYIGKTLRIELCDEAVEGWANAFFDEVITYYDATVTKESLLENKDTVMGGHGHDNTDNVDVEATEVQFDWRAATNSAPAVSADDTAD